jgi:hypothetical protein
MSMSSLAVVVGAELQGEQEFEHHAAIVSPVGGDSRNAYREQIRAETYSPQYPWNKHSKLTLYAAPPRFYRVSLRCLFFKADSPAGGNSRMPVTSAGCDALKSRVFENRQGLA